MIDPHQIMLREAAFPWPGDDTVEYYLSALPGFEYRDQFIDTVREAHQTYLAGCSKASMIMAGEALLRVVFERMITLASQGVEFNLLRKKRKNFLLNNDSEIELLCSLADELSYCEAILCLRNTREFPGELVQDMFDIKDLRNCAAHGELPALYDWDPDDRDSPEAFNELMSKKFKFPEAYKYYLGRTKETEREVRFDCREHKCESLKHIASEHRLAVIQLCKVLDVTRRLIDKKDVLSKG